MRKLNAVLLSLVMFGMLFSISGVMALDADNPYTVNMNFIIGSDTTFTVSLAGVETEIDFNPATKDSKEVEPDSQDAGGSTPMVTITNAGNVNLDFTHKVNESLPAYVGVSYDTDETVDWTKTLSDSYSTITTSVAAAGTADVYYWANFTDADAGTDQVEYQINSTAS